MLDAAAEAIAKTRIIRAGQSPPPNILTLLSAYELQVLIDDATAALVAAEEKRPARSGI